MLKAMEVGFDQMSPVERIRYVQQLWDEIAAHPEDVPVTDAMRAELDRRLADHRASPDDTIDWDEVKAGKRSDS
jgi:putative addiction module component (TIGR02574 family)